MKNRIYLVCSMVMLCMFANAQVYKHLSDTVKLNKEITEVSNDIASLTARLAIAKNNMPGYRTKASDADADAKDAAINSSNQADKATTQGGVKEARKAKRKSRQAYKEAKNARSANNNVGDQDDKIAALTGELAKKQERLEQLTAMRTAIYASINQ